LANSNHRGKVIQALRRAGFQDEAGGKHTVLHHPDGRFTTIPNSRLIKPTTLRAILKQCKLTEADFFRFYRGKR
jgi:predicted RNA binding protein YcfA (HicA-like mRNA interferase family)